MPSKIHLFLAAPSQLISAAKRTGFPLLPTACHLIKSGDHYGFPSQNILPNGWVLISSAISGGTLSWRLEDAIRRHGRSRVVLALERSAMDFSLPAPEGMGVPLSYKELQSKIHRYSPSIFFSRELCAQYFVYQDAGKTPRFVLFDDAVSLRKKLQVAQSLGLTAAVAAYPQIHDWLDEIKGWEELSSQPG